LPNSRGFLEESKEETATMKRIALVFALVLTAHMAQAQQPAAQPAPQLSTSDKIAIQSLQKTQEAAAKEWNDAEQQKLSVLREWSMVHPGFHIHYVPQNPNDPQNLMVEADAKPASAAKPKEELKKPEEPKK
jgi:Cu/Zn superoxide dismutase